MTILFRILCIGLLLAACGTAPLEDFPPTSTTVRAVIAAPTERIAQPLPESAPANPDAAQTLTDPCRAGIGLPVAAHQIDATLDYAARTLNVRQRIRVINQMGVDLSQIILNVEPNRYPETFALRDLVGDGIVGYELTGRRLGIALNAPLTPGCAMTLDLVFDLTLPPIGRGLRGFAGFFGYSPRQINLGHWLPTMAVFQEDRWVTHDAFSIGEQIFSEIADWDVTLTMTNAPPRTVLAAPGMVTPLEGGRWRVRLSSARDFAISVSPFFNVRSQVSSDGTLVEGFVFDNVVVNTAEGQVDGAEQALTAAAQSLGMYADLFGAYPYQRFVLVQGDFPDGMEFTGLVFVSDAWFTSNNGTAQSYLTFITVHEVAHQWWYGRVGSDQAMTPWLDEALATYSEVIFYEEFYPELRDWWWQFRVNNFVGGRYTGKNVDSTVYEFASIRDYINAVYLRGAIFLDELRRDLGTEAFYAWLRRYSTAGDGRIITPALFWLTLTPEELAATAATRQRFLSNPNAGLR